MLDGLLHRFRHFDLLFADPEAGDLSGKWAVRRKQGAQILQRGRVPETESGKDIWSQLVLEAQNTVFELQLAFLQPPQLQFVLHRLDREARDHIVEIAVLLLEFRDAASDCVEIQVIRHHGTILAEPAPVPPGHQ
jgi:hypothetical protein